MVLKKQPTGIKYTMDGKEYDVLEHYRSTTNTAQPLPGKTLYHITARHEVHGPFHVACHEHELIGLKS